MHREPSQGSDGFVPESSPASMAKDLVVEKYFPLGEPEGPTKARGTWQSDRRTTWKERLYKLLGGFWCNMLGHKRVEVLAINSIQLNSIPNLSTRKHPQWVKQPPWPEVCPEPWGFCRSWNGCLSTVGRSMVSRHPAPSSFCLETGHWTFLAGHLRRHHLGLHFGGSVIGSCGPLQGAPGSHVPRHPEVFTVFFIVFYMRPVYSSNRCEINMGCISKCSSVLNSVNNAISNYAFGFRVAPCCPLDSPGILVATFCTSESCLQLMLAGQVDLIHGPYSCILPPILYSIFGTCIHSSVGARGSLGYILLMTSWQSKGSLRFWACDGIE